MEPLNHKPIVTINVLAHPFHIKTIFMRADLRLLLPSSTFLLFSLLDDDHMRSNECMRAWMDKQKISTLKHNIMRVTLLLWLWCKWKWKCKQQNCLLTIDHDPAFLLLLHSSIKSATNSFAVSHSQQVHTKWWTTWS